LFDGLSPSNKKNLLCVLRGSAVSKRIRYRISEKVHVRSPSVNGVVVQTEYLWDLIEEFWVLTR
jgi:hypothetical protein